MVVEGLGRGGGVIKKSLQLREDAHNFCFNGRTTKVRAPPPQELSGLWGFGFFF